MKQRWPALLLALGLVACGNPEPIKPDNLPWQVSQTPEGYTEVFHLQVGKSTLRDLIELLHVFPELAVFMGQDKQLSLEAYFGKQRLGVFEARLIAELGAEHAVLEDFANQRINAKPQPSGDWRFGVSESNQKLANDLLVKYLIYMPVADYEPDIVTSRFGEPAEVVPVKTSAAWWFYPAKGLAMLLDTDGGDILYYSSQQDFPALKQRLLTEKTGVRHE